MDAVLLGVPGCMAEGAAGELPTDDAAPSGLLMN